MWVAVQKRLDEKLVPQLLPPKSDGSDPRECPNCENGRIGLKLGRFFCFIGCSNYPECKYVQLDIDEYVVSAWARVLTSEESGLRRRFD